MYRSRSAFVAGASLLAFAAVPAWAEEADPEARDTVTVTATRSPVAMRCAPVYDRYYAINRHQAFPDGWIHWQDNTKMGQFDGSSRSCRNMSSTPTPNSTATA